MYESVKNAFEMAVNCAVLLAEFAGVCVLVVTLIKAFYGWLMKKGGVRLYLAQGIALALEFKMGGEVLRTVVVREWSELLVLGAIILLRGALTFLIHWEIKKELRGERLPEDQKNG